MFIRILTEESCKLFRRVAAYPRQVTNGIRETGIADRSEGIYVDGRNEATVRGEAGSKDISVMYGSQHKEAGFNKSVGHSEPATH